MNNESRVHFLIGLLVIILSYLKTGTIIILRLIRLMIQMIGKQLTLRNKVNNLGKTLKKRYCSDAINQNVHNSKKIWSTIKKLIPTNKSSVKAVETNNGLTNNDKETANEFNDFFTSIGNDLAQKFDDNMCDDIDHKTEVIHGFDDFKFDLITEDYVFDQLCSFPNNKSTGLDNFHVKLLKLAAPIICHPLTYICNLSLITASFPSELC